MTSSAYPHQYIHRESGRKYTERLLADRHIDFLYSTVWRNAPRLLQLCTSSRASRLLAWWQYDRPLLQNQPRQMLLRLGINTSECLQPVGYYTTMRRIFERQIRYWEVRPLNGDPEIIASPADARMLIGSFRESSTLWVKDFLFDLGELLGRDCPWLERLRCADFAVFRLTPDKYHYNHCPVSGRVLAIYTVDGHFHSCNPLASINVPSIYSKNRRVVTIIDTDVEGGSQVGLVAMVEIVALMIGEICQAYSETAYQDPQPLRVGQMISKGCPKSLYRPGSSTDVLLFEAGRVAFSPDIVRNSLRRDVQSRFTLAFGRPLVETEVRVRSSIARRKQSTDG